MCLTFPSLKMGVKFIVILYITSCTSVDRHQNFAGISSLPEERDGKFVRNFCVFGATYKMSVSRIRLSELEHIQLNLVEMRYNILDWIQLARVKVNRWTAVKAVNKFTIPLKREISWQVNQVSASHKRQRSHTITH